MGLPPARLCPVATVYGQCAMCHQDGVFEPRIGPLWRLVREIEGRAAEPSACVLDSQAIRTPADVHLADQGTDAGKRIIGRKRHFGCRPPRPAADCGKNRPIQSVAPHLTSIRDCRMRHAVNWWSIIPATRRTEALSGRVSLRGT
ncbi:hypothetical protein GCM10010276_86270 [Streptomyces longisporus]|uniref:Transposase n=1 Tax=Streptomyces longisporus TaxID=1948 RepID=A0ABP6ASF6_STRLO